jgi:hypothetical protein
LTPGRWFSQKWRNNARQTGPVIARRLYYANERHKKIPERYNEMAERYKIIGMTPQIIWRSSQFIEKMATNFVLAVAEQFFVF